MFVFTFILSVVLEYFFLSVEHLRLYFRSIFRSCFRIPKYYQNAIFLHLEWGIGWLSLLGIEVEDKDAISISR
jgi:hypothetical protein